MDVAIKRLQDSGYVVENGTSERIVIESVKLLNNNIAINTGENSVSIKYGNQNLELTVKVETQTGEIKHYVLINGKYREMIYNAETGKLTISQTGTEEEPIAEIPEINLTPSTELLEKVTITKKEKTGETEEVAVTGKTTITNGNILIISTPEDGVVGSGNIIVNYEETTDSYNIQVEESTKKANYAQLCIAVNKVKNESAEGNITKDAITTEIKNFFPDAIIKDAENGYEITIGENAYFVKMDGTVINTNVKIGDFIQYEVEYKDAYENSLNYSSTNGWRLINYGMEKEGMYTNIKLISTGFPAKLSYDGTVEDRAWQEPRDSSRLEEFMSLLGGDSYSEKNYGYTRAFCVAAGMYYNFGNITFNYGLEAQNNDEGWYSYIKNEKTVYDDKNTLATGNDLFLNGLASSENAGNVRIMTLTEVNKALGRTDINSLTEISKEEDPNGIYRLSYLKEVDGMSSYVYSGAYNYLATNVNYIGVRLLQTWGDFDFYYGIYGVRPVITLGNDMKIEINPSKDGKYFTMERTEN